MTASAASSRQLVPVQRSPAVLWREGEFGVVLLAPKASEPMTLSGTGRALWRALARPKLPTEIAAELGTAFEADPGRVEADIAPVLEELLRVGALEEVRP